MINGDFSPPTASLRDALSQRATQVVFTGGASTRWIALNTKVKPFNDINVRKAVLAGMDRNALVGTRGGALAGDVATHFLPPGMAGFDQAGGTAGPGVDFLSPDGSPRPDVSAKYFKAAGYPSGKYDGQAPDPDGRRQYAASAAKHGEGRGDSSSRSMGFKITAAPRRARRRCTRATATRLPRRSPSARTSAGSRTSRTVRRCSTRPSTARTSYEQGNTNWPQLDVPAINRGDGRGRAAPQAEQRPRRRGPTSTG